MLIDSNIIIYSVNSSSPKNKIAQEFLVKNRKKLYIAHQNIFESLRVLTHIKYANPMQINSAVEAVNGICDALNIIYPQLETHYLALELIERYKLTSNKIFDAYLVATMLSNEIEEIVTDNEKDFEIFEGVKVINPFKN